MRVLAPLLILLLCAPAAKAALSRAELAGAGVSLPPSARLDLALAAPDATGTRRTIGGALDGRPGFLVFVDYRCDTLCGTELQLLSAAIEAARLDTSDFRLLAIGINPMDPPAAARDLERQEVPPDLQSATVFLLPDAATLSRATKALGFDYVYDAEAGRFAHPAAVYLLRADGTATAALSPFALLTSDIRGVLAAAGPEPSGLGQRIRLLCYAFDPVTGRYGPRIEAILKSAAVVTMLLLGGAIVLLSRTAR